MEILEEKMSDYEIERKKPMPNFIPPCQCF
jgi:hypothetical protein